MKKYKAQQEQEEVGNNNQLYMLFIINLVLEIVRMPANVVMNVLSVSHGFLENKRHVQDLTVCDETQLVDFTIFESYNYLKRLRIVKCDVYNFHRVEELGVLKNLQLKELAFPQWNSQELPPNLPRGLLQVELVALPLTTVAPLLGLQFLQTLIVMDMPEAAAELFGAKSEAGIMLILELKHLERLKLTHLQTIRVTLKEFLRKVAFALTLPALKELDMSGTFLAGEVWSASWCLDDGFSDTTRVRKIVAEWSGYFWWLGNSGGMRPLRIWEL